LINAVPRLGPQKLTPTTRAIPGTTTQSNAAGGGHNWFRLRKCSAAELAYGQYPSMSIMSIDFMTIIQNFMIQTLNSGKVADFCSSDIRERQLIAILLHQKRAVTTSS
jgi:hypothetical protein